MNAEKAEQLKEEARLIHLIYTTDSQPGYIRVATGNGFKYFDNKQQAITDAAVLERIRKLALPPAWSQVWICSRANGHLQATGLDIAGRKQYKYHALWTAKRNEHKHNRMHEFAAALPKLRKRLTADLHRKEFPKEKVLALAVSVMDKTFIRVGNSIYAKLYGSFGLTSLRNRHIRISGSRVTFQFKGKKGVQQMIELTHASLSKMLNRLKDLPGQSLFQYMEEGSLYTLESGDINQYIHETCGADFTAKDFRTWWGTVTAARELALLDFPETQSARNHQVVEVLDKVARRLGNTRAVCKKYYVHPQLLQFYLDGKLQPWLEKLKAVRPKNDLGALTPEERIVAAFIREASVNW
ncbi:MAG: DNA topoisomerase IB [Chitinophagales bacterium]